MESDYRYYKIFNKKSVMGTIYLGGITPAKKAIEELELFKEEGIDGAVIENYCGTSDDVITALKALQGNKILDELVIGVNILPNEFYLSIPLAEKYNLKFVQLSYVSGEYSEAKFDYDNYSQYRIRFPNILVFGGVHPKDYVPLPGSDLKLDLEDGMKRAEAIVVSGKKEISRGTNLKKINEFRKIVKDYPLIVGPDLKLDENVYDRVIIADGVIAGNAIRIQNDPIRKPDKSRIKELMDSVKNARQYGS